MWIFKTWDTVILLINNTDFQHPIYASFDKFIVFIFPPQDMVLGGKLAPELLYFALKKELLNFSEIPPTSTRNQTQEPLFSGLNQ